MSALYENTSRLWASVIITELTRNGVTHFYVSPGMRNAPLTAAITYNDNATLIEGMDERAASYRALGAAKALGKPVALVCTSGTAMANYMPAVIEARRSNIPLVIISSDRPKELAISDANQTINQENLYGDFVTGSLNLNAPNEHFGLKSLATSISHLLKSTWFPEKGPVHINAPFREPLDNKTAPIADKMIEEAKRYFTQRGPATNYNSVVIAPSTEVLADLANTFNSAKRPFVVVGKTLENEIDAITEFLQYTNAWTFIDVSSSIKYHFPLRRQAVPSMDHPEVYEYFKQNPPDVIFHFGGRLTGKHYYRYLSENPDIEVISINSALTKEDPAHRVGRRVECNTEEFCKKILPLIEKRDEKSQNVWENFIEKKRNLIENHELSYPYISKNIIELTPENETLYIANSTVIRSFDSYMHISDSKDLKIHCNRGVSGIEGLLSSSLGVADITKKPVTLIIGDVSLYHDLNALFYLKKDNLPVQVIVVNNYGGGIFTLLPVAGEKEILKHLVTAHEMDFCKISEAFGLEHKRVYTKEDFKKEYTEFFSNPRARVLEVVISNDENIKVYDQLKTVKM
ncbi:2-succinyl-5-enolpyruvyl-6-hydroxy-3-cyclohexene-1-carboxylic-acid synthase [Bacteriovorax sp. BSW11_IV]|uniref:2-succinyl-5-enolpyruvyl-6-hydroxy-3- cyclohexene-1-carboxylic-acid synthase n=1 Tax=Bacteriovorax sp. BSW11_IV TaxID=1353529 RepID=UPI00038A1BA9|nr:2-succinyl-5-enolpyruvyl-6-hydroxy-3-cyclohexene-1-carboxylic-acid synthase [Bacteriovorax sp. BSW11_IV]EQC49308.1 2-succinyl-5-enolpyruvyl-6-hydroxy-3-cyclohexene-1-carboxylic-acid synthase [Bacteriovorax sp. BSW11_IV]